VPERVRVPSTKPHPVVGVEETVTEHASSAELTFFAYSIAAAMVVELGSGIAAVVVVEAHIRATITTTIVR
jgi:hypothetical protein